MEPLITDFVVCFGIGAALMILGYIGITIYHFHQKRKK